MDTKFLYRLIHDKGLMAETLDKEQEYMNIYYIIISI
jgi:hypothetical protein